MGPFPNRSKSVIRYPAVDPGVTPEDPALSRIDGPLRERFFGIQSSAGKDSPVSGIGSHNQGARDAYHGNREMVQRF